MINTIILAGAFLMLFASAEVLYHWLKVHAEITRKYVHLVTGLLTMLFPPMIGNHWLVLFLCGSFLVILLISLKFKLLPSINAVDRVTRGSLLYPIIVYGCYLAYLRYGHFSLYYIPILILAICDPVAALVGKGYPIGKYTTFGNQKTMSGSGGFFVSALIVSSVLLIYLEGMSLLSGIMVAFMISLSTTIAEALTHKGYDNFTIPGTALIVLMIFESLTVLI